MAKRQAQKQPAASKASRTRSRASFRTHRKSRPPRSPATDFTGAQRDDYLKAVGLYEQGIGVVQRRNFATAATTLRQVIELFPEEHELHERCRLYLKICEREVKPPAPPPQTPEERVCAATLALNAGAIDEALRYLEAAGSEAPESDHVQYMLAVACALKGETGRAIEHLQRAIELNPDNRLLARQEPDFESLRGNEAVQRALEPPHNLSSRHRSRNRSPR